MLIEIVDQYGQPVVGASVFSSDAFGTMDNVITEIADENGVVHIPEDGYDYITIRAIGQQQITYDGFEVPHYVEMQEDQNQLSPVTISASATDAPINWWVYAGIIGGILIIGSIIIYLRNNNITK